MSSKKNLRKAALSTIAASASVVAIAPAVSAADATSFPDVTKASVPEHYDNIIKLTQDGVIKGFEDGRFYPWKDVTRGQVAVMIANALDLKTPSNWETVLKEYSDVKPTSDHAKEIAAVTEAGIFKGKLNGKFQSFTPITREQMATVLVGGFNLSKYDTGEKVDINLKNVSPDHAKNVQILANLEITNQTKDFRPAEKISRAAFSTFLVKTTQITTPAPEPATGITSVKAINDTTVSVNFANAMDKDFIREAEKNGKYFRVFVQGDSASSDKAVKSSSIRFSEDGKYAEFTLGQTVDGKDNLNTIESGKKYTVALTDSDSKVASVLYDFGPTTLKAAATAPDFEVSATTDKVIVNYGEKMKDSALAVDNYTVYDNGGNKLGALSDFVTQAAGDKGEWSDATTKTSVEFNLGADTSEKLKAGRTYKLYVDEKVQTDDNKKLSDADRTISVKTPSISDAQPKAKTARTEDKSTIVVSFDQKIDQENVQANKNQVEVKTATGKIVTLADTAVSKGDAENEIKVHTTGTAEGELAADETYKVSLPANTVTNAVFPNASNDAISSLESKAQDNVEIKSVKAELKADAKDKRQANLHLEFDQRPDLSDFNSPNNGVRIVDGTDVYTLTSPTASNVKFTGEKSVVIENVEKAFDGFKPEKDESYKFEINAGTVHTAAFGNTGEGVTNQSKLVAAINGVSVSAPRVDKITLVSGKEIKIDFKENISSVSADDVTVAGYEQRSNGGFGEKTNLTADNLTTSVSGSTLTVKAKDNYIFNTSIEDTKFEIKANSFNSQDSKIANNKVEINKTTIADNKYKTTDNAAPVLIGAEAGDTNSKVDFTFSEKVDTQGSASDVAKLFAVSNAANSTVGSDASASGNKLSVTFNKPVFDESTVLSRIEVKYTSGNTFYVKDANGNKTANTVVKGVQGQNPGKEDPSTPQVTDVEKVENQINALPSVDKLTLANEQDVKNARTAYNNLSAADQAKVSQSAKDALKKAEDKIEELKNAEGDTVTVKDLGDAQLVDDNSAIFDLYTVNIDTRKLPENLKGASKYQIEVDGTKYDLEINGADSNFLYGEFDSNKFTKEQLENAKFIVVK